jgi:hypothetical protein
MYGPGAALLTGCGKSPSVDFFRRRKRGKAAFPRISLREWAYIRVGRRLFFNSLLTALCCACHSLQVELEPAASAPAAGAAFQPGEPTAQAADVRHYSHASVALGYFEPVAAPVADCDGSPRSVRIERGIGDSILHFLIGGVYSTRSIAVVCRSPVSPPARVVPASPPKQTPPPRRVEPARNLDRIYLRSGKVLQGRIVNQTRTTITIDVNGRQLRIQKQDVRRVAYPK